MAGEIKVPFAKASIDEREIEAVVEVMRGGWLTMGPKVAEFEEAFAKYVGAKYAVAVSSGTAALFLALKALDVDEYSRAYVPSLTFSATAAAAVHAGASINFVDVEDNMLMRETIVQNEMDVAIPVDLTGAPIEWDGYRVVHDCAHRIDQGMCEGKEGMFCFSFYPTKNLASAEGGMIAFNNPEHLTYLKMARTHGQTKDGYKRYKEGGSWEYQINFPGWKMNMTDIQAAIGLEQLKKLPRMDVKRWSIVEMYNNSFGYEHQGLHLYPVFAYDREKFINAMWDAGIHCSVHFLPLHNMPAYVAAARNTKLKKTEWFGEHLVSLPLYPDLATEQAEYVIDTALATNQLIGAHG